MNRSVDEITHPMSLMAGGELPGRRPRLAHDSVVRYRGTIHLVVSKERRILGAILDADEATSEDVVVVPIDQHDERQGQRRADRGR